MDPLARGVFLAFLDILRYYFDMKYAELLEIHFWNGESYSSERVFEAFRYLGNAASHFTVTFLDTPSASIVPDEESYERFPCVTISADRDSLGFLEDTILKKIIICIEFQANDPGKNVIFRTTFSKGETYYSGEFAVEEDDNNEMAFLKIQDIYQNLIRILRPTVSNGGFEVLWEDARRIREEKCFEGFCGYAEDVSLFPFIPVKWKNPLGNGYLFMGE